MSEKDQLIEVDTFDVIDREKNIVNLDSIISFFFRRSKIIILSSSILFSFLFIKTIDEYINNPIYYGSFTILIEDPIDNKTRVNSFEENLAMNQLSYRIPTLIQYLKSEYVLNEVAEDTGINALSLKNRINIELDGTKPYISRGILKVSIKGKNKIQNLNIMRKLSTRYLKAASEQREERLITGINFLDTEVPIIEKKRSIIKKKIEDFRLANNVLEPLNYANNIENKRISIQNEIKKYKSNIRRLKIIKEEISLNQFKINGFIEFLSDLGMNIISSEKELINEFILLENKIAKSKTKFNPKSRYLVDLQKRLDSISPEIKRNQFKSIELAINSNKSKINLKVKELEELNKNFKNQPNLLGKFEQLKRELEIAENNFDSLISAKDNFRLELAQKSLPWRIIEKPSVSPVPISPNVKEDTIRNFLLTFMFGIFIAYIRELTDKVFHDDAEVETSIRNLNVPLLGSIPYIPNLEASVIRDEENQLNDFLISEAFRNLATSIRFFKINTENKVNKFVTTSASQNEGKTTITSLLARTFAALGQKVLLVDGDMRRPSVHKAFEKDNILGLSNLIIDTKVSIDSLINKTNNENLDIITAGTIPPDPISLLSSNRMNDVNNILEGLDYDLIFIDAPPAQGLADAMLYSRYCDLVFLIVGIEDSNKTAFLKVLDLIKKRFDKGLGVIVNRNKELKYSYSNDSYNYYNKNLYNYYNGKKNSDEQKNNSNKVNLNSIKMGILDYWKKVKTWVDF